MRFVGRISELNVLGDAFERAQAGSAAFVLVEGPGGIGKTTLVCRFLRDLDGVTVLWISGDEAETDLEFGLVEQLLTSLPERESAQLVVSGGMGPLAVGAEVLARLGALEQVQPVVLVIDDLHLADRSSSQALLFVLRRLRRDQVLVVATARPQELGGLGAGWARVLGGGEPAHVIRLDGLNGADVRALAAGYGRDLPVPAAQRLWEHTDGNPLYVRALLDELPPEALRDASMVLPAPRSYAATVLARLGRLPATVRDVVNAAAVFETTHVPLRAIAAMCAEDDPAVAVEEAEAAGLVRRVGDPAGSIGFTHPLVRAAVYNGLSSTRRRELHRAAAENVDLPAALRQDRKSVV